MNRVNNPQNKRVDSNTHTIITVQRRSKGAQQNSQEAGMMIKIPCLRAASWNVRGLRDRKKRKKVLEAFTNSNRDVLCLQETWHSKQSLADLKEETNHRVFASAPRKGDTKGQGVVTLVKKSVCNAQMVLPSLWTPRHQILMIHIE